MNRNTIYGRFTQSLFFSDTFSIPHFFLDHYRELGLNNEDLVLILHILAEPDQSLDALAHRMDLRVADIQQILLKLQKQRLLSVADDTEQKVNGWHQPHFDLSGLMDQLFEIWGILWYQQVNSSGKSKTAVRGPGKSGALAGPDGSTQLTSLFEQELGRPLTDMECGMIGQWASAGWTEELIIEALRRGVSAGIRTFRYLDSILREWEKKGIRTLEEVQKDDVHFQTKRQKKNAPAQDKIPKEKTSPDRETLDSLRAKYGDVYL